MKFCANCETEATHIVEETETPLCYTCMTAYEWGQASPEKTLTDIDDFFYQKEFGGNDESNN